MFEAQYATPPCCSVMAKTQHAHQRVRRGKNGYDMRPTPCPVAPAARATQPSCGVRRNTVSLKREEANAYSLLFLMLRGALCRCLRDTARCARAPAARTPRQHAMKRRLFQRCLILRRRSAAGDARRATAEDRKDVVRLRAAANMIRRLTPRRAFDISESATIPCAPRPVHYTRRLLPQTRHASVRDMSVPRNAFLPAAAIYFGAIVVLHNYLFSRRGRADVTAACR